VLDLPVRTKKDAEGRPVYVEDEEQEDGIARDVRGRKLPVVIEQHVHFAVVGPVPGPDGPPPKVRRGGAGVASTQDSRLNNLEHRVAGLEDGGSKPKAKAKAAAAGDGS
jgi:hypothetical protein